MANKLVSFIIPHKGREEMLLQTLKSIESQSFDLSLVEVFVITQNDKLNCIDSVDSTLVKAIYPDKGLTISALRNLGANEACGEYYAFLDADVELSPQWLTTMLELLKQKEQRKLVSAMQVNGPNPPVLEQIRTVLSNAEVDTNVSFLPGRNLFLSAATFEQVGGFPEHLITCEDYFFTDKVNSLGELYYSSEAQYVHIGEDKDLGLMYQKEVWRGQSNLQSIKGRAIPLRELPSFLVPPIMVLACAVMLLSILLGWSSLLAFSAISVIAPLMAYSWRLYQLAEQKIPLLEIIKFYSVYFPARAKGTLLGIIKTFNNKAVH